MDPPTLGLLGTLASPGGTDNTAASIFASLASPPLSGPPTGSNQVGDNRTGDRGQVFSEFRRFVSFGLRRDSTAPT